MVVFFAMIHFLEKIFVLIFEEELLRIEKCNPFSQKAVISFLERFQNVICVKRLSKGLDIHQSKISKK